jgi:endonuclease-3
LSVEEEKLEIIKPVGLSAHESKVFMGWSHILINKHNGLVPQTYKDLEEPTCCSHKTAAVSNKHSVFPAFP